MPIKRRIMSAPHEVEEQVSETSEKTALQIQELADEAHESLGTNFDEEENLPPVSFASVVSTGSTLLDLAITGGRVAWGGIPGGIFVEVSGPEGAGKTAILSEIAASAQSRGGDVMFLDPEGRLDMEYTRIYGAHIKLENYAQPDTVTAVFDFIKNWNPKPKEEGAVNVICVDSLAALTTQMEMESGDKMGTRRAKEFSAGLRVACRNLRNDNWLLIASNQERDNIDGGRPTTPGGRALRYYASLRIRVSQDYKEGKIEREAKLETGKVVSKIYGIRSTCSIIKSSVDIPYRTAPLSIIFNYGVDDIRENLRYVKDMLQQRNYWVPEGKDIGPIEKAISWVEESPERVIALRQEVKKWWKATETRMEIKRPSKVRG